MLSAIESAIASRLEAPLQALGVRVRVSPDATNGISSSGFLIIGYTGSSFTSVNQKTISSQQRTLDFEISISYKSLQTHKDTYPVIETILGLLTGFQPIECDGQYGALYATRDGFVSNGDGYWRYSITFSMVMDYPTIESIYLVA